MLDLAFVREHLDLVEEKLRQRGANPAEVLKDFREIDARRRQAITQAETLKAQRNRATEEIAKLKKAKQDAAALIEENKNLRAKIEELEKEAEAADGEMRDIMTGIPNLPNDSVPVGKDEHDKQVVRTWASRGNLASRRSRIGSWARDWGFLIWEGPRS
jgi:seryl-tRNA synthetase